MARPESQTFTLIITLLFGCIVTRHIQNTKILKTKINKIWDIKKMHAKEKL